MRLEIPEHKRFILGLHGHPRVGKTALADMFAKEFDYAVLGFADALYEEVAAAFNVTVNQLRSHEWKTMPQPELAVFHCMDPGFYNLFLFRLLDEEPPVRVLPTQEPRTSRWILQRWGTEYRRNSDENYWILKMKTAIQQELMQGRQGFVLHDLRFNNEAAVVAECTGMRGWAGGVAEITRASAPAPDTHVSNNPLKRSWIDHTFTNNGTIDELYQQVKATIGR